MLRRVNVLLCKTNLLRLGSDGAQELLAACQTAGSRVERRDCLNRCQHCQRAAIAIVDGSFVGAPTSAELAAQLEVLREDA